MTRKAVVAIDGGYFDHIHNAIKVERSQKIDINKFSQELCDEFGCDHLRTKFYHAPPYQDENPTEEQKARYGKAQSFFHAINNQPNHQFVKTGRVKKERNYCPECEEEHDGRTQTGVDVGIAVDMINMAMSSEADFVFVTGDGDMKPAITQVKNQMSRVYLAYMDNNEHGVGVHGQLLSEADDHFEMNLHFLESCRLE